MSGKDKDKSRGLSNQDLKSFRSKVAKLKKKDIVSKRVDARSQAATKYMRAKVRKFEDVLSGQSIAVKAKKSIREKYVESGVFQERGSFLIVPKEHERSRARIKKGRDLIEIITPLKYGEEREIVLPFKPTDMMDLAEKVTEHGSEIDKMKNPDEQFAFRLFGHNSKRSFVNHQDFSDHVLRNYQHLFTPSKGKIAIRHLSVIKFKGKLEDIPSAPPEGKIYNEYKPRNRKPDATGRNSGRLTVYERHQMEKRALRKKTQREKETDEQRKKRLDEQRERSRKNRQTTRDKK